MSMRFCPFCYQRHQTRCGQTQQQSITVRAVVFNRWRHGLRKKKSSESTSQTSSASCRLLKADGRRLNCCWTIRYTVRLDCIQSPARFSDKEETGGTVRNCPEVDVDGAIIYTSPCQFPRDELGRLDRVFHVDERFLVETAMFPREGPVFQGAVFIDRSLTGLRPLLSAAANRHCGQLFETAE